MTLAYDLRSAVADHRVPASASANPLEIAPNVPTIRDDAYHIVVIFRKQKAMKRIFLFIVTNLAVLALLSVVVFVIEQVFGVRFGQGGLGGLLVFAAVFGFGGALISLAMSKWTAKRMMGVRVIPQPQSELEPGLEYGPSSGGAGTHRHARSRYVRIRGDECVCDRRPPRCRAGRREHRIAAQHAARRRRKRYWAMRSAMSRMVTW